MGIRSLCNDLCCEVLDAVIPNRTKRLIMLSSLCPVVADEGELTDEYMTLLNTQLSLCREEEALKLPLSMSHSIWKDLPDEVQAKGKDPEFLVYRIMAVLPEWLRYDKDNVILEELQSLLRFNSVFHNTHHDLPCHH